MLKENLKYVRTAEEGASLQTLQSQGRKWGYSFSNFMPLYVRNDNLDGMNVFCEMIIKMDKWRPKYSVYIKEIEFEINLATKKIPVLYLQSAFPLKIWSADLSLSFSYPIQWLTPQQSIRTIYGPAGAYKLSTVLANHHLLLPWATLITWVISSSTQYPHQGALENVWEYELSLEIKKCH